MTHPYASLLSSMPDCVVDPKQPYQYLTERHVQAIWYEQKYFKGLETVEGEPIEVLSPGRWNGEAGPDFLQAHLKIGGLEWRGAVEIHLTEEQWIQHGHDRDARYEGVVLHLAFWKTVKRSTIKTAGGRPIIRAMLQDFLTVPPARIVQLIDVDLYPYKKFVGSGRCGRELFRKLSADKASKLFEMAADWRLNQKYQALQLRLDDPALFPAAGIAMALGYKHNTEAFFQLFLMLLKRRDEDEERLLSYALGVYGFFDRPRWEDSPFFQRLIQKTTATRLPLVLHQVRPLNHPVRRIAYLVKLIKDPRLFSLKDQLIHWWKENYSKVKLKDQLANIIPTYKDSYWNHHFTFEAKPIARFLPLIGQTLIAEIAVNTLLPIIHDELKEPLEITSFYQLYLSYTSMQKGKTLYLRHRFFGDTEKGDLLKKAMREQGAYQLHRDFCSRYEASCEGCPFVERYQDTFID